MIDPRLSKLHKRAVVEYRQGTGHRWVACLAASRIVGEYDQYATLNLATDLRLSPSGVRNLARAGLVYRILRKSQGKKVQDVRINLTPSHFSTIGTLMLKYDLTSAQGYDYLHTASEEGASVEQMRSAVVGEHDTPGSDDWLKVLSTVRKGCDKLWQDEHTDEIVANAARYFLAETEGYDDVP